MCVFVCRYVHVSAGAQRPQELDPLDLELQVVGRHMMRAMGIKLSSSGKAVDTVSR